MTSLRRIAAVSAGVMVGLTYADTAAAFGSDRAAWLQYLHEQNRGGAVAAPARHAVTRGSTRVETGRIRTDTFAMRNNRLGVGHLPQIRRQNARPAVATHGILPMRRNGTAHRAAPQQRGIVRHAALRPQRQIDPRFLPALVPYATKHRPGTIVIDTTERYLYHVQAGGMAKRYGVGVGRPGFSWAGTHRVSMKREWPGWTPPAAMRRRQPELPKFMPGGPENPLGARALYLGSTLYRIHGSNQPWTIGHAVSSGCIRMRNEDVIDLYENVKVGAKVVVLR